MRLAEIFVCAVFAVGACGSAAVRAETIILDGDTIKLDGTTYRFDGIDAPELDQSCLDEKGEVYPCGATAKVALETALLGQQVSCEDLHADPFYRQRRIGRCVSGQGNDGADLHKLLVRQGWAINFEPYAHGRFTDDETEARENLRGIWKGCFVAPQEFRRWNKRTAKLLGTACTLLPEKQVRNALFPDEPQMPTGCEIKGKFALRAYPYRGIYHLPGCRSYRTTRKNERWFCSEEEAQAAGYRKAFTCGSR